MKTFNYYYSYDSDRDDFSAIVTGIGGMVLYEIPNTKTMLKILKSGEMEHIDDVEGLTSLLVHDRLITDGSIIKNEGPS